MNILVTGATGFVGSHLLQMSDELFHKDDNLILLTSHEIEGFQCVIHNNYQINKQDFAKQGIEHIDKVIHIGHFLQELHPEISPAEGNISSINTTVALTKSLPNVPDTFVYCSTMAVYGINRPDAIDENSSLQIENSYAASKAMIEQYLIEWAKENDVNLHIMRLTHIYGPKDKRRYTIPIWLKAEKNDENIKLFTNKQQYRNCLYVKDCCRFLARACYLEDKVSVINLASSYTPTMMEIAEACKDVSNNRRDIIVKNSNNDCGLYFKNADKRETYLGEEEFTLKEGLQEEYKYLMQQENEDER